MPISVDVRDVSGASTATAVLDDTYFGIEPNLAVLHQVVTAQLAAARAGTQSTKTRAEVSGGGRKPFKQKGTGRARQGSERAPQFAGGGVALGPKPRSYRQHTPKKMIQLALRSALSDRAAEGKVAVVEEWPWEEPSTKAAISALGALELDGKVLVVLSREDIEAFRSFRNLRQVRLIFSGELNAYDILCHDWLVFTRETLPGSTEYGAAPASAATASAEEPEAPAQEPAEEPVASESVASESGVAAEVAVVGEVATEDELPAPVEAEAPAVGAEAGAESSAEAGAEAGAESSADGDEEEDDDE